MLCKVPTWNNWQNKRIIDIICGLDCSTFTIFFQLFSSSTIRQRNISSPKRNQKFLAFLFLFFLPFCTFYGTFLLVFVFCYIYIIKLCPTSCTFTIFFSTLFQLHNQAETEKHVKSKTKQNLELSAKNKELTQSLKQLHQSFLATNQVRDLDKIITLGY